MSPYYPVLEFKLMSISRSFDSEGRPYPIVDDDLSGVLAKSDFAKPKRSQAVV
jgi:hypothetical protein